MKQLLIKALLSLVILTASAWKAYAQDLSAVNEESLALHVNTTFFLTGEALHFKVYCLDRKSGGPSSISTIAYVEIIGVDSMPLAQLKVRLKNGVGHGDFFFETNVPSGNYTLVAYTKWMCNFDTKNFFRSNLTVINPQIRPEAFKSVTHHRREYATGSYASGNSLLLELDKGVYRLRDAVEVRVNNPTHIDLLLSASVRAVDPELPLADPWVSSGENGPAPKQNEILIPDFRGELITGTVTAKADGKPLPRTLVTMSSPSKDFSFLVSTTDANGRFYFHAGDIRSDFLLFDVYESQVQGVTVTPETSFLKDYAGFQPAKFELDTGLMKLISRRHLSLQVENAFYEVKKDSVVSNGNKSRFFSTPDRIFTLADFTPFPTMEDIFREIIPDIVVRIRDGNFSLLVKSSTSSFRLEKPPLVLIDGIPVKDANIVMKYDPSLIKTIVLITQRYYYGGLETDGIISIETHDGDARNLPVDHLVRMKYVQPQASRIYYFPQYASGEELARIPDFRTQLYWNPDVKIDGNTSGTLRFYTGDLPGMYAIEIIGISKDGKKILHRKEFEVKR